MKKANLVYFSPALSTRKIVRMIGRETGLAIKEYDITHGITVPLIFGTDELVIFAVPVYAGRVPALAARAFQDIKGENTPSVITCIYGNREYEDALLELRDICEAHGFRPFAGGAFIARHSIFPNVGNMRPDEEDKVKIKEFAKKCLTHYEALTQTDISGKLSIKGNIPYRDPSTIPLMPEGDSKCDNCQTCVIHCPVEAISADDPTQTNKSLCIGCAGCVAVCPQHSRAFRGDMYETIRTKFEGAYLNNRKEPEVFFLK